MIKVKTICLFTAMVTTSSFASTIGQGTINFKGKVIDAPCGIASESADQSIDFGQLSKSALQNNKTSEVKNIKIKLVNCDFSEKSADFKKKVKVSFSGLTNANSAQELLNNGSTGTAVVINAGSTPVSFDGSTLQSASIQEGDNVLSYQTWVKKASGEKVSEGEFSSQANFNISYE